LGQNKDLRPAGARNARLRCLEKINRREPKLASTFMESHAMLKRSLLLATVVVSIGVVASAPISAEDPAFRLRTIADRPDVVAALNRYDALAARTPASYAHAWERDLLRLQTEFQAEVFGEH
jgi:hypothetical protein